MHYLIESPTPKTSFNCGLKTETYKLMSVPQAYLYFLLKG
jgi:hypothetical protein